VKQGRLLAELDKVTLNSAVVWQAAYNGNKRTATKWYVVKKIIRKQSDYRSDYDEALYKLNNAKVVSRKERQIWQQNKLGYIFILNWFIRAVDEGQTVAASFRIPNIIYNKDLSEMQIGKTIMLIWSKCKDKEFL
jgi:hypothetical protein